MKKYTIMLQNATGLKYTPMLMRAEEMENGKTTKLTIIYPQDIGIQGFNGSSLSCINGAIIFFGGLNGFKILEFEDDEDAILWYRMNY
jgi:hypothetical protein